jgi:hypothetical protein
MARIHEKSVRGRTKTGWLDSLDIFSEFHPSVPVNLAQRHQGPIKGKKRFFK